jgi:hypothetical protein
MIGELHKRQRILYYCWDFILLNYALARQNCFQYSSTLTVDGTGQLVTIIGSGLNIDKKVVLLIVLYS